MVKKKTPPPNPPDRGQPENLGPSDLDIVSPPFPNEEDNVASLYVKMEQLMMFLDVYREKSNEREGKPDCVAKSRPLVSPERHADLPVIRLNNLIIRMRKLRESWDMIVRRFEHCWDSNRSRMAQHHMLHHAQDILTTAYMSDEMLEAHQYAICQKVQTNRFNEMAQFFTQMDQHMRGETPPDPDEENEEGQ